MHISEGSQDVSQLPTSNNAPLISSTLSTFCVLMTRHHSLQASVPLGPLVAGQPLPDAKALLVAQPDGEMSVAMEEKKVCWHPTVTAADTAHCRPIMLYCVVGHQCCTVCARRHLTQQDVRRSGRHLKPVPFCRLHLMTSRQP